MAHSNNSTPVAAPAVERQVSCFEEFARLSADDEVPGKHSGICLSEREQARKRAKEDHNEQNFEQLKDIMKVQSASIAEAARAATAAAEAAVSAVRC